MFQSLENNGTKCSNHWKFWRGIFPIIGTFGNRLARDRGLAERALPYPASQTSVRRDGAALIVSIWVILVFSLLISSMAFDMQVEANVAAYQRKRVKAEYLARAGLEWTTAVLSRKVTETMDQELQLQPDQDEQLVVASINLSHGVGVSGIEKTLGDGKFIVDILPEQSRWDVNRLEDVEWERIFVQAGVENTRRRELIDALKDWTDEGDEHRLHGAEKDDEFYRNRGYEVKNAPLDTVDELLLVKGWDEAILYGGTSPKDDSISYNGIAGWLTAWGDDKVNVNTASRDVLMILPDIEERVIEAIMEYRTGIDGVANTKDDGFRDVEEVVSKTGMDVSLRDLITTTERKYLRVVSVGEVDGVRNGVWAVIQAGEGGIIPVYWREEAMP